jgi:phosphomevalonate kinase
MPFDVTSSAPGKILWIGGYSVLERPNVSYVTAVKAFVNVNIQSLEGNSIILDAPQLGMTAKGTLGNEGRLNIEVPKELILLKTSAEVALRYAVANGAKPEGFTIHTKNDDVFSYSISGGKIVKSGLGSSAALTVATVAAVLKAFDIKANKHKVHKLAQISHSVATGKVGSGFDIAGACYGSIVYTRYSPDLVKTLPPDFSNKDLLKLVKKKWDYTAEKLYLPKDFRITFANFIGESMVTTASIGSVSEFKKNNPEKYNKLISELNQTNSEAIDALRKLNGGDKASMTEFKEAFEKGRALSKELGNLSNVGIEPDDCTNLIEESKKNGAFVAKLPGAGGKDSIAAISLSREEEKKLRKFWKGRKKLDILKIKINKKGLSV